MVFSQNAAAEWLQRETAMMGTRVSIVLITTKTEHAEQAISDAFSEIDRIEQLMSTYIEESELSTLNRLGADAPVVLGAELYGLLRKSVRYSELSDGAFDVTYESVGQHYDYRKKLQPSEAILRAEKARIGYEFLEFDDAKSTVFFKKRGVRVNLGGIAKGYAVDRAIKRLRDAGIRSAMVTAGGDTRLLGTRDGQPWIVGVQNPRDAEQLAVRLPLEDEAISTSGDYERFFELGSERIHHIVSPRTGRSVRDVRSVTVLGPSALDTDALSTTVFVMGVKKGLALIESLPKFEAIIIDSDQRMHVSSGLRDPQSE